jgi:hypothetical protein
MANSGNVSALLKQLSSASQLLNEASNKLTEQIKEIENSLASHNLGVVAWVELRRVREHIDDQTPDVDRIESLGYSKKNSKWGLYISSEIEEFEHCEIWLLRDAPRELRILAVDAFPRLLEQMVKRAKELTTEVVNKTDRAKAFAHSLRTKPKKGSDHAK